MRRVQAGLLGLFPPIGPGAVGGVQASGRVAWDALAGDGGVTDGGPTARGPAHLFCGQTAGGNGQPVVRYSKPGAVLTALGTRWSAEVVLVWHLALLKLVPLLRLRRARLVVFLHGIEAWRSQDWLTRRLLPRVDLFLTNSDHTWERFLAFHPECRRASHETVHLGLEAPRAGAVARPDPVPTALMLGRLMRSENYKGHRQTLAAWPAVLDRVPQARLWIAGDGDERADLERLAARGPARDRIRFWGVVSERQKEELLIRSRCLLLPSRAEGFGLVYLEAMRLGRPCLVGSLDAGREVVHPPECGLAVDPDDGPALAAAAARLLTPGVEWDAWSARARHRYERRFTAGHFARRLTEALAAPDRRRVPA